MKKKSIFFTLLICLFSIFGSFAFFDVASATSQSASVWDGIYPNSVTDLDYFDGGSNVYIRSAKGFAYFAYSVNKTNGWAEYAGATVYLETDIDLANKPWTPIGNSTQKFRGTFDGQSHTIFNLNVSSANNSCAGLFGVLSGQIKNLKIKNAQISVSATHVGTLAGKAEAIAIENCAVQGKIISGSSTYVGGFVGDMVLSEIIRSYSEVEIKLNASQIGGLAGRAVGSTIEECFNAGAITSTEETSTTDSYIGGLVGLTQENCALTNCYNLGTVSDGSNAGGLIGRNIGSAQVGFAYNRGDVSDGSSYNAGLVGFNASELSITDAVDFSNISCNQTTGTVIEENIYNLSTKNLDVLAKTREFYSDTYFSENWDFSNVWAISTSKNNSLPYLKNVNKFADNDTDYSFEGVLSGEGSAENPYQIKTAGDLGWLSFNYQKFDGAYFALQNNIDLSGKTWQPIGTDSHPFSAVFDGNGYTITGITCSLQEQFTWHGLFGITQNAVIKNLTVSDFKVLTPGSGTSGYLGTFIAEAREKTYLINCNDSSQTQALSVGKVEGNSTLFVFYGRNNTSSDGAIDEGTLKLDEISFTKGYDIEINGDGGHFYDKTGKMYSGSYHVLADETLTDVIDVSAIDTTFGKTLLPTTSESFGVVDTLIKRGHKLTGYKYNSNDTDTSTGLVATNIGLGLTAVWSDPIKVGVTIEYNKYERDYFGATSTVSNSFEIDYDSWIINDYSEIFSSSSCPETRIGFEIEGFYKNYSDGDFSEKINEKTIVNSTFPTTIYAKWKGKSTDDAKSVITIEFNKAEGPAGNFEIADAVKSLTLFDEAPNLNGETGALIGNIISFDYDTTHSDTMSNWLNLQLALNEGYELAGSVVYPSLDAAVNTNFGVLTLSGAQSSSDRVSVDTIEAFNAVNFYNLSGNYSITISLQRKTYNNKITTGSGVIFGVAPNILAQNLSQSSIYNFESSANENLSSLGFGGQSVFVGYDFASNKLLTSNSSYGAITLDEKYKNNGQIRLTVDGKYFLYEFGSRQVGTETVKSVTLSETDGTWQAFEQLVYIETSDEINFTASWLSKSSFEYIFSTEDDQLVFNDIRPISADNFSYSDKMFGEGGKPTKFVMEFTDVQQFEDIKAVTAYTQAVFHYNFVDEAGKAIKNAPTLTKSETSKDVTEGGGINFAFNSSYYYKFASDTSAVLYNNDGYNLKFVVSNVAGDETETWTDNFNANNEPYFVGFGDSEDSSKFTYTKGADRNQNNAFNFDTYEFSLKYNANMLRAGYYEVYITCIPVEYNLQIDTKFVDFADTLDRNNPPSPTNFSTEDHGITTDASKEANILFDDEINISTALGDNKAYEFYGWYFEGENYQGYIDVENMDYEFVYGDRYLGTGVKFEGDKYKLKITAVYFKKEAKVEISDNVILADENGAEQQYSVSDLKLGFALNKSETYRYTSQAEKDTSLHELQISKTGNWADGFYLVGWKLLLEGEVISEFQSEEVLSDFDVYDSVKEQIELGNTSSSQEFLIVPVIRQKQANIYFYSGASNKFNTGKIGRVFDESGNETTEEIYLYSTLFNNSSIYLSEELGGVVIDKMFAARTGYHRPSNEYWRWTDGTNEGSLNGSSVVLSASFFENGEKDVKLYFYRTWEANTYYVAFDGNGSTSGVMARQTLTYDTAANLNKNSFNRAGYEFAGWAMTADGEKAFDDEMEVENLTEINGGEVTLYAVWAPKQYTINIYTNGANTFNGQEIALDEQLDHFHTASLLYGQTFAEVDIDSFEFARQGYTFAGIFTQNRQKITNSTVLDNNLPGFSFDGDENLRLFVVWNFDSQTLSLTGVKNTLNPLTYNAQNQTVELFPAFEEAESLGFVIAEDTNGHLTISLPENWHTSVTLELSGSENAIVENVSDTFFKVKNAGYYSASLVIRLSDICKYLPIGNVSSRTLNFYVNVNKADVSASVDDGALLVSAKKLLKVFTSQEKFAALSNCSTFESLGNVLGLVGKSQDEIKEFVFTKYYRMLMSTGREYVLYKNWTFDDFAAFKAANPSAIMDVSLFTFVEFYEYGKNEYALTGYDSNVHLKSENVASVELSIEEKTLRTLSETTPNSFYRLRIYLANSAVTENYDVYSDGERSYIEAGQVLLLPEILTLENQEEVKYSYFNQLLQNVEVSWQGDRDSFEYLGEDYYLLKDKLFINAQIFTSNLGYFDADTAYGFMDETNYLYFNKFSIVERVSDGEILDVTNRFGLVMSENDQFTILSTEGMARFEISANYLTLDERKMTTFGEVPSSLYENLLKITSVTYDKDGSLVTLSDMDGLEAKSYEDAGVPLFQIFENNKNTVSIFINPSVKKLTVSTTTNYISDYIGLYKWSDRMLGNIDGTMERNGSLEIDVSELSFSEEELSEFYYYAVYTDLVQVNYNLNLPSGYINSTDRALLKLGTSTYEDLPKPNENGLVLSSLYLTKLDGSKVNLLEAPSELFAGTNGEFVGLDSNARHTRVLLEAKWQAEEMQYEQRVDSLTTAASTLSGVNVSDIISIENRNENLYTYSYAWYKGATLLSSTDQLTLRNNGSFDESGSYRLQVTATLKKLFENSVDNPQSATTQVNLSFEMTFLRSKVTSVSFEGASVVYDSKEHINDWTARIAISSYNTFSQGFDEAQERIYRYVGSGNLYFEVLDGLAKVTSMKNAGSYSISARFDENVYDLNEGVLTSFNFTISPLVVDLLERNIHLEKRFNSQEQDLQASVTLGQNQETLLFTRALGEDVGEYDLYFEDILQDVKTNYTFTAGNIVVFENGTLTAAAKTTPIGTFEIVPSGRLLLRYDDPAQIVANYNSSGYTIALTDSFNLQISSNATVFKTVALKLYDEASKVDVTQAVKQILNAHIDDLTVQFFDSTSKDKIVQSGNYTYNITVGEEFGKYYSQVAFETGYGFQIQPMTIDVQTFDVDKTYDGRSETYFTLDGSKIEDVSSYNGVYVVGTYENLHAGENVKVNFSLSAGDESLSNYALSTDFKYATISKLRATMTISMTQSSFVYGTISQTNFQNYVSRNVNIVDENGVNVSNLLEDGYYQISYSLSEMSALSAAGNVKKGRHKLSAQGAFSDFDMTVTAEEFEITALEVEKTITPGYITISTANIVQEKYTEEFVITTGDTLTLEFYPVGLESGVIAAAGNYELALVSNEFEDGSIVVKLTEDNTGFAVVRETETVYLHIADASVLAQNYNASNFIVNIQDKVLQVTNGANAFSSDLTFVKADGTDVSESITFDTLEISGSFKDAGKYRLSLRATSSQYSNVVLDQVYFFEISPIAVDVAGLSFNKVYDGTDSLTITEFAEKIEGDNVSIFADFDTANAGANKDVTLYLQGAQKANYLLSATAATGAISKANAQIELKEGYTYGQIDSHNLLSYKVICDGKALLTSDYSLTLQIEDPQHSAMGYLCEGTYNVSLVTVTSANFVITLSENATITVEKLVINPVFTVSGEVVYDCSSSVAQSDTFEYSYLSSLRESVSLTLTREAGSIVGSYRVLSGVSNNANYSVGTLSDSSTDGMFKLIKASQTLYLLLSDEETISEDEVGTTVNFEYDGKVYDQVGVSSRGTGLYNLKIYNSQDSSIKKEFALSFYTLSAGIYTKESVLVDGLETTLKFLSSSAKDVGNYAIYSSGTVSSSFDVRMGKNGSIYSYYINIEKRQLYFKNAILEKTFDNHDAVIDFADASELLDNTISDEQLSATVKFMDGANVARYADANYDVNVELFGENLTNYNLNMTTQEGEAVYARIMRADITFIINSQSFVYGKKVEELALDYSYQTDVDLSGYDISRMNFSLSILANANSYSKSGALKVGEYSMFFTFNSSDFVLAGFITDSNEQDELLARLLISPIELSLTEIDKPLSEIFTKNYDGNNTVKIRDKSDNLLFNLEGVCPQDIVILSEANYISENMGQAIQIDFTLSGDDKGNYTLASYPYGKIIPTVVNLEFDYRAGDATVTSNVDSNGLETLSQLAYPFMSMSNLTSNSLNTQTNNPRNFPTSLSGRTGFSFTYWTLEFEVANGSAELGYLDSLTSNLGLSKTYTNGVYAIRVGNDESTIRLLSSLVSDENDHFGLHFANSPTITFKANWDISRYRVTVVVEGSGQVDVLGTTVTNNFLQEYEYGTVLTLRASANEHSKFAGFFVNGTQYTQSQGDIEIGRDADVRILTVTNVRQSYNFVVKFAAQDVNIEIDLSSCQGASIEDDRFTRLFDNTYLWSTNYTEIENLTISNLPQIQWTGHELVSYSVGGNVVEKENFDSANIADLILSNETVTLSFVPTFVAVGVVVTLDYGYKTEEVVVPYGSTYGSAAGWEERPERTGYDFDGWHDDGGQTVVGTDQLARVDDHKLTAQWNKKSYSLSFTIAHAQISNSSVEFERDGQSYSISSIPFESEITFSVTADEGYTIAATWSEEFDVILSADEKTATVTFTMPAQNFEYAFPIIATQNVVTIEGEHIAKILDASDESNVTELPDHTVAVETGEIIKLQIFAEEGYELTENVVCDSENVIISKELLNDTLTLEISGITKDTSLTVFVETRRNFVTFTFDDPDRIENIEVNGLTYNELATLPSFEVFTEGTLSFRLTFKHGYTLDNVTSDEFAIELSERVQVSQVFSDGTVNIFTKREKFTLTIEVISYNESHESVVADNIAFANGESEVTVDFESEVELTYLLANRYSFAGWSKDGETIFGDGNPQNYTVTQNETIYAIFSTMKFNITLATYDYYSIYEEYGDPSMTQEVYREIRTGKYLDGDKEISSFELFYGANKTFDFVVPQGYRYYGFGYNGADGFVYLDQEERSQERISINLSSARLEGVTSRVTLYMVVRSRSASIAFKTSIDIDGVREEDLDVGHIELSGAQAEAVNDFGYVDGTRVHYDGSHSDKQFTVVAYSQDVIYIKISTMREGYKFSHLEINNSSLSCLQVVTTQYYSLYAISNILGGMQAEVEVLYRPHLNSVDLKFECEEVVADAGAFTIRPIEANKVWWSGRDYSAISVSAYTDSSFEVFAYIRAGYYIDGDFIEIKDENSLIESESIRFENMDVVQTGFTGRLSFKVKNYLGTNSITVCVKSLTYTVLLKEGSTTLAQIKNVEFGKTLNLYEYNSSNITILDERIIFENEKLKVDLQKENHNFDGFFTYENGAGVRYIDSAGNAINSWSESGYVYNSLTKNYQLADNAKFNVETGEMEISLYIYWSYLKTRISIEMVPSSATNFTAKDVVSGVDHTNSWFYETAPKYIEVAFNTNIQISAPTLEGYKFYKFVVSQKDASGLWLADVEAFAETIPWSTNELDRIVECNIKIIYFAQVEVLVVGGEGSYKITQESSDSQARVLLQQSYVDTTKPFQIEAVAGEGFSFVRWAANAYGQKVLNLQINSKTTLVMNLQGEGVTLDFSGYDFTHGQILNVRALSLDNSIKNYRIGAFSGNNFIILASRAEVKVGDKVTFILQVENGFAVSWLDRNDISYVDYIGGMMYFEMNILPTFAGKTLQIVPIFDNTIISLYVQRSFADFSDKALDKNNVELAGSVLVDGKSGNVFTFDRGQEIKVGTALNARYEIAKITLVNYGRVFRDIVLQDGQIILSADYLEQKNIIGTAQLLIEYKRALWTMQEGLFEGEGTTSNPYKIKDVDDLSRFMDFVNSGKTNENGVKYADCAYILEADLNLAEKFWTPIGTTENAFNGYFNFNDHTVTGIYNTLFYETTRYNGLFGVLGSSARIVLNEPNYWFVYMSVVIVVSLILLLVAIILIARKRKKQREELSKK